MNYNEKIYFIDLDKETKEYIQLFRYYKLYKMKLSDEYNYLFELVDLLNYYKNEKFELVIPNYKFMYLYNSNHFINCELFEHSTCNNIKKYVEYIKKYCRNIRF